MEASDERGTAGPHAGASAAATRAPDRDAGSRAARRAARGLTALLALGGAHAFLAPPVPYAACNQIPPASLTSVTAPADDQRYAGDRGFLSRPFSGPGEPVEVGLYSCAGSFSLPASDYVVTLAFGVSGSKDPRELVAITAGSCDKITDACRAQGIAKVACISAAKLDLAVVGGVTRLAFTFPDTSRPMPSPNGERHTLAGPGAVAVKRATDAPPVACGLRTGTCAGESGLVACIDRLFADDGACGTAAPNATFPQFTALPPPTAFKDECFEDATVCTPYAGRAEVAFALDAAGNVLVPLSWEGISPGYGKGQRVVDGTSRPWSKEMKLPDRAFVSSHAPSGRSLGNKVEVDANVHPLRLWGPVYSDTPSVLRIQRWACQGGTSADAPCPGPSATPSASICPGGRCAKGLFDFSKDIEKKGGPVVFRRSSNHGVCHGARQGRHDVCHLWSQQACTQYGTTPCERYALHAEKTVTATGITLVTTTTVVTIVEAAPADGTPGGLSASRFVTLRDRETGIVLGPPGGAAGDPGDPPPLWPLAATDEPGLPAVAAEGDVVALLAAPDAADPEAAPRLRVLRRATTDDGRLVVDELTEGRELPAATTPLLNGQSVVVSEELVFHRTAAQAASAPLVQVFDARAGIPAAARVRPIAAAGAAAIAGEAAVFLRPSGDPGGGAARVMLWTPAEGVRDLERAAVAVAASPSLIAALVPGGPGADGAGTVAVRDLGGGTWKELGQAADRIAVADRRVILVTPERSAGVDLNGDGDARDRVLQVYDADTGTLRSLGQAASDFVVGDPSASDAGRYLAFRTPERAQRRDLNADGDGDDTVLQVYRLGADGEPATTGEVVEPCTLPACDPRRPYEVVGRQVRYLGRDPEGRAFVGLVDACPGGGDRCVPRATRLAEIRLEAAATGFDPLRDWNGTLYFPGPAGRCAPLRAPRHSGSWGRPCPLGMFRDPTLERCVLSVPATCRDDAACGPDARCVPITLVLAVAIGDEDGDGIPDGVDPRPQLPDLVPAAIAASSLARPCFVERLFGCER